MTKQDLNWKWYDSVIAVFLIVMAVFSAIINDWMLVIVSLALLGIIFLMVWKDIYVFIGDYYLKRGNFDKAHSLCDKVLSKDEKCILALNEKAEILKTEKDYEKALKYCNKSIKENNAYFPTWILKSEIHDARLEKEEAEKAIEKAEKIKLEFESKKLHNRILSKIYGFD